MSNLSKSFWNIQKFVACFQKQKFIKRFVNFVHYRQKFFWIQIDWNKTNRINSFSTNLQSKFKINLSKILLLTDNNATGRKMFINCLFSFSRTSKKIDLLLLSGKIPEFKELRNIIDNAFEILESQIFNIGSGMLSRS